MNRHVKFNAFIVAFVLPITCAHAQFRELVSDERIKSYAEWHTGCYSDPDIITETKHNTDPNVRCFYNTIIKPLCSRFHPLPEDVKVLLGDIIIGRLAYDYKSTEELLNSADNVPLHQEWDRVEAIYKKEKNDTVLYELQHFSDEYLQAFANCK